MKPLATTPKATLIYLLMVFIFLSYAAIRVLNLSQAVQSVKSTADTASYMRISRQPLFDPKFLAGSRPLIFPLVLKLFGNNEEAVAWAQGMLSILSWGLLAVAMASSLHLTFLRLIAFGLILLLSLYRYVIAWDSVLLTESVSLSLLALSIAGWLWLAQRWRWYKVMLLSLVTLLWTFSRDTNAWVVLMVALFLSLLVVLRQINKKYIALSIAFIGMFLLSNLSADRGDRWVFPFQNILGRRILAEAQAVNFFANCGMPVSPSLMQLAGGYANSSDRAFYENPALESYRVWLHQNGKLCYVKWLLSNPLESIKKPIVEFDSLVSMQNIQPFLFSKNFSPVLPARLEAIFLPRQMLLFVFIVLFGLALIALFNKAWVQNKSWWVIIGMILLIFPHYFITWHGDVMGIYRHVLAVSIQFYLGIWLFLLLVVDSVLTFMTDHESSRNWLFMKSVKPSRN